MKYIINLFKRKKFGKLLLILIIIIIGLFPLIVNLCDLINNGIHYTDNVFINVPIIAILGTSNLGMVIIGIIVAIYLGLIFVPRNAPEAQDDSDYEIVEEGDLLYIKYKDKEFKVKKDTFEAKDLFFKDMNNKHVSMTTGYQIYNYVKYKLKK